MPIGYSELCGVMKNNRILYDIACDILIRGEKTSRMTRSSHVDQFSNLFHCQNKENICNNIIIKDPTALQVCRYTTL